MLANARALVPSNREQAAASTVSRKRAIFYNELEWTVELTALLREHLDVPGTTPDGPLFRGARGGPPLTIASVMRPWIPVVSGMEPDTPGPNQSRPLSAFPQIRGRFRLAWPVKGTNLRRQAGGFTVS